MSPVIRTLLLTIGFAAAAHGLFKVEGGLPPGVDTARLAAEYFQVYHLLAPESRVDRSPITLVFYREHSAMALEGILPEWGGGGALGANTIVMPIDKPFVLGIETHQTLLHELVHVILNRAYARARIPRWFHEGAAMTFSGEISLEEQASLSMTVLFGRLVPLDSIDRVNEFNQSRASLAYSESHAVFLYLLNEYGIDVIRQILVKASRTGSFWEGVRIVLGLSKEELAAESEKWIHHRYGAMFIFGDGFFVWIIIVVLFLTGYVLTRLRNARRVQQMTLEEEGRGAEIIRHPGESRPPTADREEERPATPAGGPGEPGPGTGHDEAGDYRDDDFEEESDPYDDFNDYYHPDIELEDDDPDDDPPLK